MLEFRLKKEQRVRPVQEFRRTGQAEPISVEAQQFLPKGVKSAAPDRGSGASKFET